MRKLFILIMIVAALTIFTGFQIHSGENQKTECQFIKESLKDIGKIKTGMTRKDLFETFEADEGLSTRTQNRYVYKKCGCIKVDVKFEPTENKNDINESPDDKIIDISKPYLEYSIVD